MKHNMFKFTQSLTRQKQQSFQHVQQQKRLKKDLFDILDHHSSSDQQDIQTFQEFKDWANSFPFEKNWLNIRRQETLTNPKVPLPVKNQYLGISRKIHSLQITNDHKNNTKNIGYQAAGTGFLDVIKEDMNSRQSISKPKRRSSQTYAFQAISPFGKETLQQEQDKNSMKKSSAHSSRSFNGFNQINQYQIRQKIGSGAFSQVHLCIDIHTQKKYAMKILEKKNFRKKIFRKNSVNLAENFMQNEIAILKKMQHQFIIKLYEVIADDNEQKTYLVLDYCKNGFINQVRQEQPGETLRQNYRKLLESECRRYMKQLCLALHYIHYTAKIAHRDIKPENILLSQKDQVKLSDFGLGTEDIQIASKSGTRTFMPPEILNPNENKKVNIQKSDIWATGITLLIMLTGKQPQAQSDEIQTYIQNLKDISYDCRSFISSCLNIDPDKRISSIQMLKHPWIDIQEPQKYKEIVISKQDRENAIISVENEQILTAITKLHLS